MTEKQAIDLGKFIDNIPEKDSMVLFEELIAAMSLYFGTVEFSEIIDSLYDNLTEKGMGIEAIAKEVKKQAPTGEDIFADLSKLLKDEEEAWMFAEEAVLSIVFNPEYPKVITDELASQEIELEDFSANLIVSFKDTFLDIFVNDMDVNEWRDDVIDALVASWDQ
jgi:hypothetical protein